MRAVDPNAPARHERRHAEFRHRLLSSVAELLDAGSAYAELTVEQIATAAGTSRSTFYLHFRDKGQLLTEFVGDVMGDLIEVTQTWWAIDAPASREQIREQMEVIVLRFQQHASLVTAVGESAGFDPAVREAFDALMASGQRQLADHVRRGQEHGWVTTSSDPEALAGWLVWMAERGMTRFAKASTPRAELDLTIDALADIVWSTLYAGADATSPG